MQSCWQHGVSWRTETRSRILDGGMIDGNAVFCSVSVTSTSVLSPCLTPPLHRIFWITP